MDFVIGKSGGWAFPLYFAAAVEAILLIRYVLKNNPINQLSGARKLSKKR